MELEDKDECIEVLKSWKRITEWKVRPAIKDQSGLPDILDPGDSLIELIGNDGISLSRMADGELALMTGIGAPNTGYQSGSESISAALKEVMSFEKPACRVALPKTFFYRADPNMSPDGDRFANDEFLPMAIRGNYFEYVKPGYEYMDASMSVLRAHYPWVGRKIIQSYYSLFRNIFRGKDILLVTGDLRCFKYERNLLKDSGVKSITLVNVSARDAWSDYEPLKNMLMRLNGSGKKLVVLSCGPMASVLAYELSDKMRCLDVGHVFGDYNLAMGGQEIGYFWG